MSKLLEQLKKRRLSLRLKQKDMLLRAGFSRQQYQQLESKGNPRMDTLELISKGLNSELMLIPQEKLLAIKAILETENNSPPPETPKPYKENELANDPWQGLLGDNE